MKEWGHSMNLKIYIRLVKNSFKQTFAYRTSSIIMFIVSLLFFVLQILSVTVFYEYTDTIAGYTYIDSINLINTGAILTSLNYCLFILGTESIYDDVLEGEMDYKFLRPINSYWFYAFYGIDLQNLITAFLHICLQIFLFTLQDISMYKILTYILMIIIGLFYMFFISRLLTIIVFYTDKADSLQGALELFEEAASKPKNIYPNYIKYPMIFIISYLMVINGPIDVLKGEINYIYLTGYIISGVIIALLSYILWFKAIKKYQSSN